MKRFLPMAFALWAAACAIDPPGTVEGSAVDDYVAVGVLEQVDKILRRGPAALDRWQALNEYYVIYRTRDSYYLMHLRRRCRELFEDKYLPDRRWKHNEISARHDTFRSCRIDAIYQLTEDQAAEISGLGQAPGSGN